jgi:hypothetical protein
MRLQAGAAAESNVLNQAGRSIKINDANSTAGLSRDPLRERVCLMISDNPERFILPDKPNW